VGLTPKKRPCSSARLVKAQAGSTLLPHAPIYVDSFGPLYPELGLTFSPQPQTNAERHTRDKFKLSKMEAAAGLSPATAGEMSPRASTPLASPPQWRARRSPSPTAIDGGPASA